MSKDFFQARLDEVGKMTTVLNSFTVAILEGQIAGTVRADAEVQTRAGCDFRDISHHALAHVTNRLNNRPRKRLNYLTPLEALNKAGFALQM